MPVILYPQNNFKKMDDSKMISQPAVGMMTKIGAIFLALWGILHVWVGYEGIHQYLSSDVKGMWEMLTGGSNAPHNLVQHTTDALTANAQKQLLLNFCIDVGGYGVLGLMLAWIIYRKGSWMAYMIAVVAIGICDLAFLFSLVTAGIIEYSLASISGPVIWFLAVVLIPFGLPKKNSENLTL